jgi:hypothetical protein
MDWDIFYSACKVVDTLGVFVGARGGTSDLNPGAHLGSIVRLGNTHGELVNGSVEHPDPRLLLDIYQRFLFKNLLIATRHYEATDPRDKICAIQGLATGGYDGLQPDYSLSASEVYAKVAQSSFESEGSYGPTLLNLVQVLNGGLSA